MSQIPPPPVTPVPSPTVPATSTTVTSVSTPDGAPSVTTTSKAVEPGWQTTEFWQSLLATAAGIGLIVFGVVKDKDIALQWGVTLAGLSAGGYALGRGIAKK